MRREEDGRNSALEDSRNDSVETWGVQEGLYPRGAGLIEARPGTLDTLPFHAGAPLLAAAGESASGNVFGRLAVGAAAGLAGSMALQAVRTASGKLMPDTNPPMRQDPGEAMVEIAEDATLPPQTKAKIPEAAEKATGMALGMAYGAAFGALYAAVRPRVNDAAADTPALLREGALLGVATWAVGYLGWLPALDIMPPVTEQKKRQIAVPILQHVLYGVATVAAFREISQRTTLADR